MEQLDALQLSQKALLATQNAAIVAIVSRFATVSIKENLDLDGA